MRLAKPNCRSERRFGVSCTGARVCYTPSRCQNLHIFNPTIARSIRANFIILSNPSPLPSDVSSWCSCVRVDPDCALDRFVVHFLTTSGFVIKQHDARAAVASIRPDNTRCGLSNCVGRSACVAWYHTRSLFRKSTGNSTLWCDMMESEETDSDASTRFAVVNNPPVQLLSCVSSSHPHRHPRRRSFVAPRAIHTRRRFILDSHRRRRISTETIVSMSDEDVWSIGEWGSVDSSPSLLSAPARSSSLLIMIDRSHTILHPR